MTKSSVKVSEQFVLRVLRFRGQTVVWVHRSDVILMCNEKTLSSSQLKLVESVVKRVEKVTLQVRWSYTLWVADGLYRKVVTVKNLLHFCIYWLKEFCYVKLWYLIFHCCEINFAKSSFILWKKSYKLRQYLLS